MWVGAAGEGMAWVEQAYTLVTVNMLKLLIKNCACEWLVTIPPFAIRLCLLLVSIVRHLKKKPPIH